MESAKAKYHFFFFGFFSLSLVQLKQNLFLHWNKKKYKPSAIWVLWDLHFDLNFSKQKYTYRAIYAREIQPTNNAYITVLLLFLLFFLFTFFANAFHLYFFFQLQHRFVFDVIIVSFWFCVVPFLWCVLSGWNGA